MPVTLRDIARHLNLSHATVSFVINDRRDVAIPEATRRRVLDAAKELGYQPNRAARALAKGKTQMVALCIPSSINPFYAEVLSHLQRAISQANYDVIYCQAEYDNSEHVSRLATLSLPVDAIIAIDTLYPKNEIVELPELVGRPFVSLGTFGSPELDSVLVDLEGGAEAAMKHLLDRGSKKIVFVHPQNLSITFDPRAIAYTQSMDGAGLTSETVPTPSGRRGDVREAVKRFVEGNGTPEAIFAYNDQTAIGAIRALHDLGVKIPQECAVVGCDGIEEAEYMEPPLSTIQLPIREMCEVGWQMVVDRLEHPELPIRHEVLPTKLVVRGSSA